MATQAITPNTQSYNEAPSIAPVAPRESLLDRLGGMAGMKAIAALIAAQKAGESSMDDQIELAFRRQLMEDLQDLPLDSRIAVLKSIRDGMRYLEENGGRTMINMQWLDRTIDHFEGVQTRLKTIVKELAQARSSRDKAAILIGVGAGMMVAGAILCKTGLGAIIGGPLLAAGASMMALATKAVAEAAAEITKLNNEQKSLEANLSISEAGLNTDVQTQASDSQRTLENVRDSVRSRSQNEKTFQMLTRNRAAGG